jgi:phosphohistidine phosphatase
MLLIFMRHGAAEEQGHGVPGLDEQRRLTKEGIKQSRRVADALNDLKIRPTLALTSPLVRAVETAEAALGAFKKPPALIIIRALAPDGSWAALKREIQQHASEDDTVLLVGHQPSLGEYVLRALGATPREEFGFPKSGCFVLEYEDSKMLQPAAVHLALSPAFARRITKLK